MTLMDARSPAHTELLAQRGTATFGDPGRVLADIDHFWMRLLCCPDFRLARCNPRPVRRHLVSSRRSAHPAITHIRLVGESGRP